MRITRNDDFNAGTIPGVQLQMRRDEAQQLFHAINRTLSLLDNVRPDLIIGKDPDTGDQAAYDRVNEFLAQMQRELGIDPEGEAR